ncbi:ATP-binding cassette domain-containing protein [Pseudohoeflea suaedae]|uniref:ATP-binding cassette domain-containing protein n=1 Tax=Pseudohoeflea suaedae TaxID=877384 RepID=A0A4R5PKN6_9HYPH|nr:ATP-binding cassette domain-containing protein [Pseudohoeflea suaedae]TDH36280.1 ATP-binding cassette domain-containing protein [Pseudohoeflea suaedae]
MLEATDIGFAYRSGAEVVCGVTLALGPGQTLGIRGPSGCGKSTLARLLAGYLEPQRGTVHVDGEALGKGWCPVQYVHQSAIVSVDPRWRIGRIVEEGWEPDEASREALGVPRSCYDRYPHEVSGGELQRICLLRALAPETRFLVADELTAMVDPVTQADIWRHLRQRSRQGLGIVAISHDQALLRRVADSIHQMDGGRLTELEPAGAARPAFAAPGRDVANRL